MTDKWELTPEALDDLLSWLDKNRDQAGLKYHTLHHGLVKVLTYWGCCEAEDLADETINRVARKVAVIRRRYQGDPARYFFAVAKKVYQEYVRKRRKIIPLEDQLRTVAAPDAPNELIYNCLEACMQKLNSVQREIMKHYYQDSSGPSHRETLAKRLGITIGTLRVRVFRIVADLETCVKECLEHE